MKEVASELILWKGGGFCLVKIEKKNLLGRENCTGKDIGQHRAFLGKSYFSCGLGRAQECSVWYNWKVMGDSQEWVNSSEPGEIGAKGCCRGGGWGPENRPARMRSQTRRTFQKLAWSEWVWGLLVLNLVLNLTTSVALGKYDSLWTLVFSLLKGEGRSWLTSLSP